MTIPVCLVLKAPWCSRHPSWFYLKTLTEISNWGWWGANDQLGTLNNISNSNIIDAKKLVIEGKTISLSRNMSKESNPFNHAPIKHEPFIFPADAFGADPELAQEGAGDIFEIEYHGYSHTHIDAINHFGRNGKMYRNHHAECG